MKIKTSSLLAIASFFLVFFEITYIPYQYVRYALIVLIAGLLLIDNFKLSYLGKNAPVFLSTLVFAVAVVFVSFLAKDLVSRRNPFLSSIVFAAMLLELLLVIFRFSAKGEMKQFITIYFKLSFLAAIAVDFFAIFFSEWARATAGNYLNGTKFWVIYLHCAMIAFYSYLVHEKEKDSGKEYKNGKTILFAFFVWSLIMSIIVDCNTGMIALALLAIFLYSCKKKLSSYTKPFVFGITLGLSFLFMWVAAFVLSIPAIQSIIENVFNTSATLTGRLNIYLGMPDVMESHWWLGFGYGSCYEITRETVGYSTTQNGLMNWLLETGIVGTCGLLLLIFTLVRKNHKKICPSQFPFYALAYVFLVLGTIETTFTLWLFGMLFISYGLSQEKTEAPSLK